VVNRRGTTWRRLDDATRDGVTDARTARAALLANPSLIKRPVMDWGGTAGLSIGFDAQQWPRHAGVKQ